MRYYLAEAIRDTALLGVAVVRIEFDALESTWERGASTSWSPIRTASCFWRAIPPTSIAIIRGALSKHLATESAPPNYPGT